MLKKIWELYKTPLLLSLTLAIVLVSLNVLKTPFIIAATLLGALVGTFILDLDYIIYAYFTDTEKGFSVDLRSFFKHKDYVNALNHIYHNKDSIEEKTLNSALFQIVLAGVSIFTMASTAGFFIKALVISAFANSIYKALSQFYDGRVKDWFWALKTIPNKNGFYLYIGVLVLILIYNVLQF